MYRPRATSQAGFTLVELLVVVLIMSILLTIGAAGFKNIGGKGVSTAMPAVESLFDEARSTAMGKGTLARILIDIDDQDSEQNYLKRFVMVYEAIDDEGKPISGQWELGGKGYTLPSGVFFSRDLSKKNHESKSGELDEMTLTGVAGLYNGKYLYYEFNSEGICTTGLSGNDYSAPSFVIGAGVRGLGEQNPRTTGEAKRDFGGFVIWRNGATSVFRNPDQILGGNSPKTF